MSEVLVHQEEVVCRCAVIDQVLLETVDDRVTWESVLGYFLDHSIVNLLVLVLLWRHDPPVYNTGQGCLPSPKRLLAALVICLVFLLVLLFLLLLSVFFLHRVGFVSELVIDSIVKVLVVELLVRPVKLSAMDVESNELVLVLHELMTVFYQLFLLVRVLLARIEGAEDYRFGR